MKNLEIVWLVPQFYRTYQRKWNVFAPTGYLLIRDSACKYMRLQVLGFGFEIYPLQRKDRK